MSSHVGGISHNSSTNMDELKARAELCVVARRLYDRGILGANEGNLSVRLSPLRILCTPAGACKGYLRPSDLLVTDRKGNPTDGGVPSSELKLHLRIYDRRPDCGAVVHAHPLVATGFALAGETIPDDVLPEAAAILGSVATAPFGQPGTDEVPDRVEPLLADHKTILMSHHGAVTLGSNLQDAANRMEVLERVATIVLNARHLGGARPLNPSAYEQVILPALNGRLS